MERFSIQKNMVRTTANFVVSGNIDENSKFPSLQDMGKPTEVQIDLQRVTGLNSVGIRSWCQWIETIGNIPIVVENVPALVIKAFNVVLGACPPNMQVTSFYVPYFAQGPGRKDMLYVRGNHFTTHGEIKAPATMRDGEITYEIDVLPNYFKFLKQ